MSAPQDIGQARRGELDALRGIAAAGVVAYHAVALQPPSREAMWALFCSPLFPLATGRPFVILFFVLSGFVLFRALAAEREASGRVDAAAFAVKRVCRIWPPFAAAGLLAAAVAAVALALRTLPDVAVPASMREWIALGGAFDPATLLRHLMLDGIESDLALNSVSWSLVYELRVALVLPILWLFVARNRGATLLVAAAAAGLADLVLAASNPTTLAERNYQAFASLDLSLLGTLYHLPAFLLGAAAAETLRRGPVGLERLGPAGAAGVFALAWAMMWFPNDAVVALGATLLVTLAATNPAASKLLRRPAALFLGRISYSLYLVHLPWLYGATLVLGGRLGPLPALLVGLATLPALSALFARVVEKPSQGAGRRIAQAIAARRRARPAALTETAAP